MEQSKQRAICDDGKKLIRVLMDVHTFYAFQNGFTKGEIYLPISWKERIFAEGRKLNKGMLDYTVVVMRDDKEFSSTHRITGADIRHVPLRRWERTDKHIVLFLGKRADQVINLK